jgi:hypothetical protein
MPIIGVGMAPDTGRDHLLFLQAIQRQMVSLMEAVADNEDK